MEDSQQSKKEFSRLFHIVMLIAIFAKTTTVTGQLTTTAHNEAKIVVSGTHVQVDCKVRERSGSKLNLYWYIEWDDFSTGITISATDQGYVSVAARPEFIGRGAYKIEYSMYTAQDGYEHHKCTMLIHSTTLKDSGYVGCVHQELGDSRHTLLDENVRLTIVPPPTMNPECILDKHYDIFVLTCVSSQSDPPVRLTWEEAGKNKTQAVQTFNSLEVMQLRHDSIERLLICNAVQGDIHIGSCSVTLHGPNGTVDNALGEPMQPQFSFSGTLSVSTGVAPTTPSAKNHQCKDGKNVVIVGGVLGVIILILLSLLLFLWLQKTHDKTAGAQRFSGTNTNSPPVPERLIQAGSVPANQNHQPIHTSAPINEYMTSISSSITPGTTNQPYYTTVLN